LSVFFAVVRGGCRSKEGVGKLKTACNAKFDA
jgi:hypothetical protein